MIAPVPSRMVIRSSTRISRTAGTVSSIGPSSRASTRGWPAPARAAPPARRAPAGPRRPGSSPPPPPTGLVIEAMRKIVSRRIGAAAEVLRAPRGHVHLVAARHQRHEPRQPRHVVHAPPAPLQRRQRRPRPARPSSPPLASPPSSRRRQRAAPARSAARSPLTLHGPAPAPEEHPMLSIRPSWTTNMLDSSKPPPAVGHVVADEPVTARPAMPSVRGPHPRASASRLEVLRLSIASS